MEKGDKLRLTFILLYPLRGRFAPGTRGESPAGTATLDWQDLEGSFRRAQPGEAVR